MRQRFYIMIFVTLSLLSWSRSSAADKYIDLLPRTAESIPSFSASALRSEMASLPLHHIEGIWRFPSDGSEVAIVRSSSSRHEYMGDVEGYCIVLLFSRNRALRPGTIIGRISPSAKERAYEARLYTVAKGSTLMMPKQFNLQLNDADTRLVFVQKRSALSVNPWRLLPYAWRYVVRRNDRSGASTAGCVRIFPAPELPFEPIYL